MKWWNMKSFLGDCPVGWQYGGLTPNKPRDYHALQTIWQCDPDIIQIKYNVTMWPGYNSDKILANSSWQLHCNKHDRLVSLLIRDFSGEWSARALGATCLPPLLTSVGTLAWTSCFGPDVFLGVTVENVLSRPMKAGTMAERLKNTD